MGLHWWVGLTVVKRPLPSLQIDKNGNRQLVSMRKRQMSSKDGSFRKDSSSGLRATAFMPA
jgi:hypothetical protein